MNSSPKRRARLSFETISQAIDDLHSKQRLATVVFAGGEPTLLGDALLESISHAHVKGINTRLVTNAAWAANEAKARRGIAELREAGLQEINISFDDYHLSYIPSINLRHCFDATKGAGFKAVVFANSFHETSVVKPDYIQDVLGARLDIVYREEGETPDDVVPDAFGTINFIHAPHVQALGRYHANEGRRGIVGKSLDELAGGCPNAVRSAAISPKGSLLACCGTELTGNAILDFGPMTDGNYEKALAVADDRVIVQAIQTKGPAYLARLAASKNPNLFFRGTYGSICEVCEHVVTRPDVIKTLERCHDDIIAAMFAGPSEEALVF